MRHADPALGVSPASAAAFRAIYAEGEHPLAADVQGVLDRIQVAEGGASRDRPGGETQALADFAGGTFPSRLDTLTKTYIRANAARADALEHHRGRVSAPSPC